MTSNSTERPRRLGASPLRALAPGVVLALALCGCQAGRRGVIVQAPLPPIQASDKDLEVALRVLTARRNGDGDQALRILQESRMPLPQLEKIYSYVTLVFADEAIRGSAERLKILPQPPKDAELEPALKALDAEIATEFQGRSEAYRYLQTRVLEKRQAWAALFDLGQQRVRGGKP